MKSKMAGQMWPNTDNALATTDNTTCSTRKRIQHDTTRQVATRHASGQLDTDRHGPPRQKRARNMVGDTTVIFHCAVPKDLSEMGVLRLRLPPPPRRFLQVGLEYSEPVE